MESLPSGIVVKNPRANINIQETWTLSLGREDALEEKMATHSSILAWATPWTGDPWQAIVYGVAKTWTQLSK